MKDKIKVVLLSHYWSEEMAEMAGNKHYFRELAPWIQETINLFKGKNDVEFHVVAPNYPSNKNVTVTKDNIRFHFYHYSSTSLSVVFQFFIKRLYHHAEPWKLAERLANVLTRYSIAKNNAIKIVREINPDIIHLFGSENPDYSKAATRLMYEYPTLLTVQGFAYRMEKTNNPFEKFFHWYMARYEDRINKEIRFCTVSRPMTKEDLVIPEKHFFEKCEKLFLKTLITKIPDIDATQTEKKYDIVFYARIVKDKGIEDLIEALARLKRKGRVLSTIIMGRGNESYISDLKRMIKEKGIEDEISFVGFVESHDDVYKMAAQSRLLVLPTYADAINNTVREAMFMRLPIVANRVDLLDRANDHRHCVHFVEVKDIDGLAEGMCKVLDDDDYRNTLIENAYQEAHEYYSKDAVYGQMIAAYKDLVEQV